MGRALQLWEELSEALEQQDVEALLDVYTPDAVWLEPQNPPHETDKLIQAYLNSWLQAREQINVTTKRMIESEDGSTLAVEWAISFTAGGRRWKDLPRSTWIETDDEGIRYQRDYY
ncbi:MAG: nuclear transport factor 2 family protein [Egibacteraceae bacterium]